MSELNNNQDDTQTIKKQLQSPPSIPHITTNYAPLSQITANVVQHTYSELLNLIETLPAVGSDLARKRRLLDFIIKSRQEFVKLYVLAKWSAVADHVSKCIDVVAWLSGQQNCFTNVVNTLYGIERTLGGAKLRNPDVETALEVLRTGEPFHKSHDYITLKPLSPKSVLKTLTNLNVLLSIRLALTEELPPQYRNYEIGNGKVKFTVENCFAVNLGIADDSVDARFFLVDFEFCFEGAMAVPLGVRSKVEQATNEMLATKPLAQVFDWLLRFSQNYKLTVLHERLIDLEGGLWANVLKHGFFPDKSLIIVYYWINRPGIKNTIEIGLLKTTNRIGIRWLRDGHVVKNHGIGFVDRAAQLLPSQVQPVSSSAASSSSVEWLVNQVIEQHIQWIIDDVYQSLTKSLKENEDVVHCGDKIRIQLTESRHTVYSIDPQTGRAILQNPSPIIAYAERQLNELTDRSKTVNVLLRLRYLSIQDEITTRATATGWVACNSVFISNDDLKKHFPSDSMVFALRLPTWSLKWFLLVSIPAAAASASAPADAKQEDISVSTARPKWWISQMEYKDNSWTIRFIEAIHVSEKSYDYKLFDEMALFTSTRIKVYSLGKELQLRNIRYTLLRGQDQQAVPTIAIQMSSLEDIESSSWAHSMLLIMNTGDEIIAQGRIKDPTALQNVPDESGVTIDSTTGRFVIRIKCSNGSQSSLTTSSNGSGTVVEQDDDCAILDGIISRLRLIERVVSYIDLIKSMKMELREASMNKIGFVYGDGLDVSVTIGEENIDLQLSEKSPHYFVVPLLKQILASQGLLSVIWLLRTTLPLYQALGALKSRMDGGVMIIARSITEIKVVFSMYDLPLEVKIQCNRRYGVSVFVTDVNPPANPGAKDREKKQSSPMLRKLWTDKNQAEPEIIPLVCGAACPIRKAPQLFDQIQSALMDNTVSIE